MTTFNLIDCCHCVKNREDFVGICFKKDKTTQDYRPVISFPYGYQIDSKDDVLALLNVLSNAQNEDDDIGAYSPNSNEKNGFPLRSYMLIIQDFLQNGYYREKENKYATRTLGKIHWGLTIKKERPVAQNSGAVYLKMQARLNHSNDEHLMTEISKHCVYESFIKMGWYYGLPLQPKPISLFQESLFISTIQYRLNKANKDSEKRLFQSMLHVLKNIDEQTNNPSNFCFGTRRFESVWEKLIDNIFGTIRGNDKKEYFPKSKWYICGEKEPKDTNKLYPDTIMINNELGLLYVVDAKYYRYGLNKNLNCLPGMQSITKQIVYAQYIASNRKDLKYSAGIIRNIFILPFNKIDWEKQYNGNKITRDNYHYIGYAESEWFSSDINNEYTKVHTVLVDTKHLIKNNISVNTNEIKELSELIEKALIS
ncbi:LlaJI restriction endonuclease [Actinobacillus indolicus]|nr:LlaJI restriction endonuclease [Actinobacillus indolicus]VTU08940.1 LlaJI restriction endonuclease [Actinobacillus indolicus]